jgi:hypothetical protein
MRALRRRVTDGPARLYAYYGGIGAVAGAFVLALDGSWVAAAATALGALALLWLASVFYWPFGEGAHLRRVDGVIREANAAMNQAHALDPGPRRKSLVAAAAEREARRLRRMKPPASMAEDHAALVELAERQAAAVPREDRAELAELNELIAAQLARWRGRAFAIWSGER